LFGKAAWKSTMLEAEFHEQVAHLMRINGWSVYSVPDSRRVSLAGYPDITAWSGNRLIFAELKREKGRVSPAQEEVLAELRQIPCAEVYLWKPSDWQEIVDVTRKGH
jgi:Holliday junction resolvase